MRDAFLVLIFTFIAILYIGLIVVSHRTIVIEKKIDKYHEMMITGMRSVGTSIDEINK